MRIVFMFLTFVVLLGACKGSQPADTTDVLVSVKGRTLNRLCIEIHVLYQFPS